MLSVKIEKETIEFKNSFEEITVESDQPSEPPTDIHDLESTI